MTFARAFGWLPVPVIYVPWLFGAGAFSPLFVILILTKNRDERSFIDHELVHIEQAWRGGLIVFALRYLFSSRYRLASEVVAYRRQIAVQAPEDRPAWIAWAARCLAGPLYRLRLTESEARELLSAE